MKKVSGREEEFEKLFNGTSKMIYNLGLRLFRNNEEDALDFSQDVYLQAFRKWSLFKGMSKASTWLYSVAMNLGLNKIKKEKRLNIASSPEEIESIAEYSQIPEKVITDKLIGEETERIVQIELEKLQDIYRIPLILFYYENYPIKRSQGTSVSKKGQ